MGVDNVSLPDRVTPAKEEMEAPRAERPRRPRPVQSAGEDRWEGQAGAEQGDEEGQEQEGKAEAAEGGEEESGSEQGKGRFDRQA